MTTSELFARFGGFLVAEEHADIGEEEEIPSPDEIRGAVPPGFRAESTGWGGVGFFRLSGTDRPVILRVYSEWGEPPDVSECEPEDAPADGWEPTTLWWQA